MDKIKERYNDLMYSLCLEHLTIGTEFSENTADWNLRDMVAECDYQLGCYYEGGHCNEEMRRGDEYERKAWRSETGKLRRFIKRYKDEALKMNCNGSHCSQYDNRPSEMAWRGE